MQTLIIAIAIGLPWFQRYYINPAFEKIILQSAEDEAERVAKHIQHIIFLETDNDKVPFIEPFAGQNFTISKDTLSYLHEAIIDFKLWKVKLFDKTGKVIYSTVEKEINTVNTKSYFHNIVAKGMNYTKTDYKGIEKGVPDHYFAEVYIPIMYDDNFIGSFEIYYDLTERKDNLDFITNEIYGITLWLSATSIILAIIMGLILDKLRAARTGYEEGLFNLASKDKLTQLLNRHSIEAAIQNSIMNYRENKIEYSLIMFDVDHFKQVNDVHGHQAGDEVLMALGSITKTRLRDADIVGRYGGEEFIALLPHTNASGGLALAENLRSIIEKASIPTCAGDINITVSLGVGSFIDIDDLAPHTLVKKVDEAMYASKHAGRNQVSYVRTD